jgi:hypothetical protein
MDGWCPLQHLHRRACLGFRPLTRGVQLRAVRQDARYLARAAANARVQTGRAKVHSTTRSITVPQCEKLLWAFGVKFDRGTPARQMNCERQNVTKALSLVAVTVLQSKPAKNPLQNALHEAHTPRPCVHITRTRHRPCLIIPGADAVRSG